MIKTYFLTVCLGKSSCRVLRKNKFLQAFQWCSDVGEMFAKNREDTGPYTVYILKTRPAAWSDHTKQVTDQHRGCQLVRAVEHDQMASKSLKKHDCSLNIFCQCIESSNVELDRDFITLERPCCTHLTSNPLYDNLINVCKFIWIYFLLPIIIIPLSNKHGNLKVTSGNTGHKVQCTFRK